MHLFKRLGTHGFVNGVAREPVISRTLSCCGHSFRSPLLSSLTCVKSPVSPSLPFSTPLVLSKLTAGDASGYALRRNKPPQASRHEMQSL